MLMPITLSGGDGHPFAQLEHCRQRWRRVWQRRVQPGAGKRLELRRSVFCVGLNKHIAIKGSLEFKRSVCRYPTRAIGRTPVIIRVVNPDALDYELESGRSFVFKINAVSADNSQVLSSCEIRVIVTDANDNVPIFEQVCVYLLYYYFLLAICCSI